MVPLSKFTIVQALLQSEKQSAEEIRRARADAEVRNKELFGKLEDAERKVDQLQDSVQRFVLVNLVDYQSSTCLVLQYFKRYGVPHPVKDIARS